MAEYVDPNVGPKDWETLGIDAEEAENIIAQAQQDAELALQLAVDFA